jgi:hypothetical protein
VFVNPKIVGLYVCRIRNAMLGRGYKQEIREKGRE